MLQGKVIAIAAFALATALMIPQAAQAEMLFLKCGTKFSFEVDLINMTVNNHPADITSTTTVWDANNAEGNLHRVIGRTTGALTEPATFHQPGGDISGGHFRMELARR